jgi:hypothetical protein
MELDPDPTSKVCGISSRLTLIAVKRHGRWVIADSRG